MDVLHVVKLMVGLFADWEVGTLPSSERWKALEVQEVRRRGGIIIPYPL